MFYSFPLERNPHAAVSSYAHWPGGSSRWQRAALATGSYKREAERQRGKGRKEVFWAFITGMDSFRMLIVEPGKAPKTPRCQRYIIGLMLLWQIGRSSRLCPLTCNCL